METSDGFSFGEPAIADESEENASEGDEVVRPAFVASVEAAAFAEPGHGAFRSPAVAAQSLSGLDFVAGDAALA